MIDLTRRTLLGGLASASVAGTLATSASARRPATKRAGSMFEFAAPKLDKVRCGIIGVGERGWPVSQLLTLIDGVEIKALCDIDEFQLDRVLADITKRTGTAPDRYTGSTSAYLKMCDRPDIDVIFVITPWDWHAPMALAAMRAGKHAFVEVPIATKIDDMWELVETSEATGRHCMMMENCCYGREELMLLNMVRQNVFGELLHGEGAYIHELKGQLLKPERGEGVWRPHWQTRQTGNLYPTHGLGPIAQYMNINRGDRFDYVVSMDSPALAMARYGEKHLPADSPRRNWDYVTGDISSSLIKTARGRTILVQHDINTPRPYDRINQIQGTNGAFRGYPARIAIDEGTLSSESYHKWDTDMAKWETKYDHPLWTKVGEEAKRAGGHGGMDFVMLWRIVTCLRNGLPVDQPVYDGAAWSALFELSHRSVKSRSAPQSFPDFTRGAWKTAKPFDVAV